MITFSKKTTNQLINKSADSSLLYHKFLGEDLFGIEHARNNMFWAGGAHRVSFDGVQVSDFDMFFRNKLAAAAVEVELEAREFKTIFKCPEGKLTTMLKDGMKIQLITEFFYDSTEQLLDSFDITACRFSYDGDYLSTFYSAIRDTTNKRIRLHKITHPAATMKRIAKYAQKGYRLDNQAVDHFIQNAYDAGVEGRELDRRIYID